ncbi:transposase [Streptomyces sp. NRRL S-337]|uniref:transposase n=1 Tax=Streptomyces sp. NRRL S-337 TaxID=1463900 RepID=UPI00131AA983|nr:transposase [Streptomyces sp. NRRL S-337]
METHVTLILTDGTVRHGQWRLLSRLLGPALHPATELVTLYHERWQAETTFSIKATLLDGRALRSRSLLGIDQEVQALLATYQAPIRTAADSACTRPDLDMDRMSCTVLLTIAADTVVPATGIQPPTDPADLLGPSAGRHSAPCTPPGADTASKPTCSRTPQASTARTPDNTPRPARATPSTASSRSSSAGLRIAHGSKGNGVAFGRTPFELPLEWAGQRRLALP